MPYSMTGFGMGEGAVAGGRLQVEIRTVNHRFFNLSARLPPELGPLEGQLRDLLRQDFDRGHLSVSVRWIVSPAGGAGVSLDLDRARAVVATFRELQATLGIPGEIDLALVARQPDVLASPAGAAAQVAWADLEPVVVAAVTECRAARRREGEALVAELRHRLDQMERAAETIAAQAPRRLARERDRLRAAVRDLLDGRGVNEERLELELALQADRLDITEELVRFGAHVKAAREAMAADRPVGKRLGFLAQELGREVNTIGSKANDAVITQEVIGLKGELEKFREQLENLE
ncbi:MAG TPA: YicC/YloC family endoribonuclease [Gemmatimonadales bacterium]|nr:YicC/YloC family endoribonuclease [Gemmatimonadales bacterium]